ncbi:hypothetical protein BV25DRAFT_1572624 [Artomyces pyxidatus]|uniref:Uncharacterized protein n=1 Tax=Artomyces pyxidatus TaxID=48021 RepID=A0ACB8SL77_9AGAM|nr:hypothetical protein BV25DRAFT_1572624 [Artomyces pyxidatus]
MSSKARHSPSASTPPNGSKFPKFLQSKQTRDRSKSMIDPSSGSSSIASSSSSSSNPQSDSQSSSPSPLTPKRSLMRKGSKLSGVREDRFPPSPQTPLHDSDISGDFSMADDSVDEPPVIVEPMSPRARTRSERPLSSASDNHLSYYQSSHSSARLTDLPTRLSGWFQHTFNTSSSDLTLPNLLSNSHLPPTAVSPKGKSSALLTAAKHGKGHLDKAMRYLLDSDSTPDKCTDVIWLLGVQHPGYEPPINESPPLARRGSGESRRSPSFRSSTSSTVTGPDHSLSQSQPASSKHPAANWPPAFYADFTSRVWITYRSHFQPIRDSTLSTLESEQAQAAGSGSVAVTPASPQPRKWNWPGTGEKGWTSDSGWGCMLRTGQSLLATALVHLHLGRDWRRPPQPVYTADYATYVQILTWFFDSPSPYSPFSVHRMALAGKDLGKDVGQWFGPSTAAGAIKTLTQAFPDAGLGVAVAVDSQIFQTDVYSASHPPSDHPKRGRSSTWGGRAVMVLIGIRLGLDGVNPIYYDTIKALYTFPQSIGIAGGRPSSSYYFVGSQADNLFYLDPHHARPTIPLRPPPNLTDQPRRSERQTTPERSTHPLSQHLRSPTSPASSRTGSSTFSYHAPISPSPLAQQLSSSSSSSNAHSRWHSTSIPGTPANGGSEFSGEVRAGDTGLDPVQEHYVEAYSPLELKTFHCDRVRKMPLSALDPSMLIGFLCKDEGDWIDLRKRIADLSRNYKTIFSVQDEPPSWPSDSDDNMGLESMSDPDMDMDMPEDDDEDDEDDTSSGRGASKSGQSEVDTEEDAIGPITPGPTARSTFESERAVKGGKDDAFVDREFDDDDEEWVDPSVPTPQAQSPTEVSAPPMAKSPSQGSAASGGKGKKARKAARKTGVPLVKVPSPPAQEHFPFPSSNGAEPEEKKRVPQMSTARARDGGRTQSGGVKGVPTTDDGDDF